jgi:hypothetical protein
LDIRERLKVVLTFEAFNALNTPFDTSIMRLRIRRRRIDFRRA